MRRGLAFLSDGRPADYGTRLARLRWARAAGADEIAAWAPGDRAAAVLAAAESWIYVPDPVALPLPPPKAAVHTLRELESSTPGRPIGGTESPVVFRPADLPPSKDETIVNYIRRLHATPGACRAFPSFQVGDPSRNERPEVEERLPQGESRILDLGCGSGGLGLARSRRPGWRLTGVEKDPARAARARETGGYEAVREGDIAGVLPAFAAEGARFDAVVFADVLEHLEEPVEILSAARAVAVDGGMLLAVVPNVGHLSIVRDLLLGRHDPVPAGLCDSGHLRWFTKWFLAETIEESGWKPEVIEAIPGAAPPDPEPFLALAGSWPEADLESLLTYQWIATARNR